MPIRPSLSSLPLLLFHLAAASLLAGCAGGASNPSQPSSTPSARAGVVEDGQQPVTGATIQLYMVGTTGDKSTATPLLSPALVTDSSGSFTIAGKFNCPTPTALAYIVATGGNPMSSGSSVNPNLAMMTALGQCSSLTNSSFTINELTTVAAAYALTPFMSSVSTVGSGTSDAASLAAAFSLSALLVSPVTGTAGGTDSSPFPAFQAGQPRPEVATVPASQINLLGDIIAICVGSTGGKAGDGTACGTLFSLTTVGSIVPTDTVAALLNLASDPTLNTAALTALVKPGAPFQPVSSVVPPSLDIHVTMPSGFSVVPSSLSFGSLTSGFTTTPQTLTLTNNGTTPVLLQSPANIIQVIGTNASDFVVLHNGNLCNNVIQPGQSCSIQVQFTPGAVGVRNAYLEIDNNSSNPQIYIPLSGQGIAPTTAGPITLSPSSSLNFTQFGVPQTLTLTNYGSSTLAINGISFGTSTNFTETDNCGTSLPAQSICTIAVSALPSGMSSTAVMTIIDDAAAGPQTTNVSYTADGFVAFVGPTGLDFGSWSIGRSVSLQFNLTTFIHPAFFSFSGMITGPAASDFNGGSPYASGSCFITCTVTIAFAPSAVGSRTATLTLSGIGAIPLSGAGLPAGIHFFIAGNVGFTALTGTYSMGEAYSNTPRTDSLKIYNSGSVPLVFQPPVISGADAAQFSASNTCTNIAPGGSCPLTLSAAANRLGTSLATMTITDSTNTAQQILTLSNIVFPPAPSLSSSFQAFSAQNGGTSAAQTITVSAINNDAVSITVGSPFTITQGSTCTSTPCRLSVVFTPGYVGSAFGTVTVTDTVQGQTTTADVTGVGTDGLPAVTLSPNTLSFPLRPVRSTSFAQTVTLTNTGTGTAVLGLTGISLTGANPGDYVLSNGCGTTLATGANCAFTISFSPTATGTRTANVQVLSNAASSPDLMPLSGTAQ